MEKKEFQNRIERVEELIREIETVADPATRAKAIELMQALMDFNGAGLDRMIGIVAEAGESSRVVMEGFANDGLVGSLLLLYGLHPIELETRVTHALDKVRPYLRSHGGNVELLGIEDGVVRLLLEGNRRSCPSTVVTMKRAIEEAIYEVAPDVIAIEAEGVMTPPAPPALVQLGKQPGRGAAHNVPTAVGSSRARVVAGACSSKPNE